MKEMWDEEPTYELTLDFGVIDSILDGREDYGSIDVEKSTDAVKALVLAKAKTFHSDVVLNIVTDGNDIIEHRAYRNIVTGYTEEEGFDGYDETLDDEDFDAFVAEIRSLCEDEEQQDTWIVRKQR